MGANISTEFEMNGSSPKKGPQYEMNDSSLKKGPEYQIIGSLPKNGQIVAFNSLSKWRMHFEASKHTSKMIVIYFTAPWCKPCRHIEPAIYEFSEKYTDVEFIKIDVDELMDVAQQYGVQVLPAFILIKKGKEIDKVVGAKKEELLKKIEKHRF